MRCRSEGGGGVSGVRCRSEEGVGRVGWVE